MTIDQHNQPAFKMPTSLVRARAEARSILCLRLSLLESLEKPEEHRLLYSWADRFVMGLPLPSFQRPLVWPEEMRIRFITSIWNNVDIGSYLINFTEDYRDAPGGGVLSGQFTDCVLDGQQRLSAIEDYMLDRIAVPDSNGIPRLYSELPLVEKRRFDNSTFSRATIRCSDEVQLREIYDLRAFGGVDHDDDQRASLAPARPRG